MTKNEFIKEVLAIAEVLEGLVPVSKKGQHVIDFLGFVYLPGTARHASICYDKLGGSLYSIVISAKAEKVQTRLDFARINLFRAKKTRSGQFCRLVTKI